MFDLDWFILVVNNTHLTLSLIVVIGSGSEYGPRSPIDKVKTLKYG